MLVSLDNLLISTAFSVFNLTLQLAPSTKNNDHINVDYANAIRRILHNVVTRILVGLPYIQIVP